MALAASVGYAFASLGPKGWRGRCFAMLARVAGNAPAGLHLGGLARRLARAADVQSAGACGGCGSCGAEPAGADANPAPEIRVPLAKILKRR